jgi:hypothetical protein
MLLSLLPPELKLELFKAALSVDISCFCKLGYLNAEFYSIYNDIKHDAFLKDLRRQMGDERCQWALAVAEMTRRLDGTGCQVALDANTFRAIIKEAKRYFSATGIDADLYRLALKVDEYPRVDPIPALGYYSLFGYFVALRDDFDTALLKAGVEDDVLEFVGLDLEDLELSFGSMYLIDRSLYFDYCDHMLIRSKHSDPEKQAEVLDLWRYDIDTGDGLDREYYRQRYLDHTRYGRTSVLTVRLAFDRIDSADQKTMDDITDNFLWDLSQMRAQKAIMKDGSGCTMC